MENINTGGDRSGVSGRDAETHQLHVLGELLVALALQAELEKRIVLQRLLRILSVQPGKVLRGHGIDDLVINLAPDAVVMV